MKLSRETMRTYNQKVILKCLHDLGSMSKAQLSEHTKLTIPAITDILNDLEDFQLIENTGHVKIKRGRFPMMHQLKRTNIHFIGIVVGSQRMKAAIVNIGGEVIDIHSKPLPNNPTPENVCKQIILLVNKLQSSEHKVYGIGIGMHGIINPFEGASIYPPHLDWGYFPIGEYVANETQLTVLVDNDCNTLTLAERWFGGGKKETSSFITLNIDYGIGAGIMNGDELFHGFNFGGGQIGHTIVDDEGIKCACGNYGCLEAIASEPALLKQVIKKVKKGFPTMLNELVNHPEEITMEHLYHAANHGDNLVIQHIQEAGRYIGIGIGTLINLFNPQKVIITGGVLRAGDILFDSLRDSAFKHSLKINTEKLDLIPSMLGQNADVIGAATLWVNELFHGNRPINEIILK